MTHIVIHANPKPIPFTKQQTTQCQSILVLWWFLRVFSQTYMDVERYYVEELTLVFHEWLPIIIDFTTPKLDTPLSLDEMLSSLACVMADRMSCTTHSLLFCSCLDHFMETLCVCLTALSLGMIYDCSVYYQGDPILLFLFSNWVYWNITKQKSVPP